MSESNQSIQNSTNKDQNAANNLKGQANNMPLTQDINLIHSSVDENAKTIQSLISCIPDDILLSTLPDFLLLNEASNKITTDTNNIQEKPQQISESPIQTEPEIKPETKITEEANIQEQNNNNNDNLSNEIDAISSAVNSNTVLINQLFSSLGLDFLPSIPDSKDSNSPKADQISIQKNQMNKSIKLNENSSSSQKDETKTTEKQTFSKENDQNDLRPNNNRKIIILPSSYIPPERWRQENQQQIIHANNNNNKSAKKLRFSISNQKKIQFLKFTSNNQQKNNYQNHFTSHFSIMSFISSEPTVQSSKTSGYSISDVFSIFSVSSFEFPDEIQKVENLPYSVSGSIGTVDIPPSKPGRHKEPFFTREVKTGGESNDSQRVKSEVGSGNGGNNDSQRSNGEVGGGNGGNNDSQRVKSEVGSGNNDSQRVKSEVGGGNNDSQRSKGEVGGRSGGVAEKQQDPGKVESGSLGAPPAPQGRSKFDLFHGISSAYKSSEIVKQPAKEAYQAPGSPSESSKQTRSAHYDATNAHHASDSPNENSNIQTSTDQAPSIPNESIKQSSAVHAPGSPKESIRTETVNNSSFSRDVVVKNRDVRDPSGSPKNRQSIVQSEAPAYNPYESLEAGENPSSNRPSTLASGGLYNPYESLSEETAENRQIIEQVVIEEEEEEKEQSFSSYSLVQITSSSKVSVSGNKKVHQFLGQNVKSFSGEEAKNMAMQMIAGEAGIGSMIGAENSEILSKLMKNGTDKV